MAYQSTSLLCCFWMDSDDGQDPLESSIVRETGLSLQDSFNPMASTSSSSSSSTSSAARTTNGYHDSHENDDDAVPTPSSPASSTSSLPSFDPSESFPAPLGAELDREPSIDGTSIGAGSDYDPSDVTQAIRKTRLEDIDQDERAEALRIKSDANKLFTSSKYPDALAMYTLSLNKNPFDPAVWCNRAATRLKMEEHGLAIADATKALELDAKYTKAYYRRAVAQLAIMRPKAAISDFKKVVSLEPGNKIAKQQLESTQKLVRRLEFEKA